MAAPFLGSEVLPPKAYSTNDLTRSWAETQWARYGEIDPDVIRAMLDPARIPLAFIDELAVALSVDVWDPAWPEATKRAVIAASPEVHRTKGTVYAVELALAALGQQAVMTEWWQTSPPGRRGTFRVTLTPDGSGPPLDLPHLAAVVLAVKRAKPKSRTFGFDVRLSQSGKLFVGAAGISVARTALAPRRTPPPPTGARIYAAASYRPAVQSVALYPRRGAEPLQGSFYAAAGHRPVRIFATLRPRPRQ